MSIELSGPWNSEQIDAYLKETTFPLRLACVGRDGYPRVVSLWYRYDNNCFYCVTHRDSSLSRLLQHNNKVGFEVAPNEPPYHGIRGQGQVTLMREGAESTLRDHLDRYLGGTKSSLASWLLSRSEDELLLEIRVERIFSWDYRERMADAS